MARAWAAFAGRAGGAPIPVEYTSPTVQLIVPEAVVSTASDTPKVCAEARPTKAIMITAQHMDAHTIFIFCSLDDGRKHGSLLAEKPS
jgi:hypothetical protein